MHLPGPLRAAVGLAASAADEARHLPDRAIELPMLAVSTALQMSLRAQQRYARLAARGDRVLNPRAHTDDPPPWATFDEPVSAEELRTAALAQLDSQGGDGATSKLFDDLFGVSDPGSSTDESTADDDEASVTPITQPAAKRAARANDARQASKPAAKAAPTKAAPTKTPPAKAPAKTTPAKTPAKAKTSAAKTSAAKAAKSAPAKPAANKAAPTKGKSVSKPRHIAPSRFDDVSDD